MLVGCGSVDELVIAVNKLAIRLAVAALELGFQCRSTYGTRFESSAESWCSPGRTGWPLHPELINRLVPRSPPDRVDCLTT
jgi:hypothetical protein